MPWLVEAIRNSSQTLWGIDFPFGLPIELGWTTWPQQLAAVRAWTDTTNAFGVHCCERSKREMGVLHTRRRTDTETKTPFDCYHYRIVYQMFHGMRDVLLPLRDDASTCILPFDIDTLDTAQRIVVEACPGSTLKRLKLPHNRYKQTKPGPYAPYRAVRRQILSGIAPLVEMDATHLKTIHANLGGDALDAVVAAVGAWHAWSAGAVEAVRVHPRYRHEGMVFC
jgi:Protein of unknown function (DUF429)